MRFLITGHTGFKGAWLTLWLASEGHEVFGLSLDPEPESLFEMAAVGEMCTVDQRGDIRDSGVVRAAMKSAEPEVVVHMAAQPLVIDSYRRPRWTVETNVMGTLNILESVKIQGNVKGLLVVTTDKVYLNRNLRKGYLESDPLGGNDPYSASKAMADILTQAWSVSFPGTSTAVARAGNVIGGGDASRDRLLPDIVKCLRQGKSPVLRYPDAVRPWQHVLDCLNGYRHLIDKVLVDSRQDSFCGSWNFGPDLDSFVSVSEMTDKALKHWGSRASWETDMAVELHEEQIISLDSRQAKRKLAWRGHLNVDEALKWTLDWYSALDAGAPVRHISLKQIEVFQEKSREA